MADAKQDADDRRNACLMALIANVNRDPKKKNVPFQPSDFMMRKTTEPQVQKAPITALKAFLRK